MKLEGRVVAVTGGGRGIGAAIVEALAHEGAQVAVWDLDESAAQSTAAAVAGPDQPAAGFAVDVASRDSVQAAAAATIETLGPIDALVNNAGVDVIGPFIESDEEDWDRIISINLKGVFNTCRAVLPGMIERKQGTIVNLGSDAGRVGSSGEAVYSATKGGVIAFTKTLAREHARDNVTVNCVCPGPTDTALLDQVAEASQKLYDGLARAIPLRRIAQPADIAKVVAFLAGPDAAYMTGQTLSVSGGLTMA